MTAQDEVVFRRGGEDIERRLHHVVARSRQRHVDDPRRLDVDAGGLEARQRLGARRLDRDAAGAERIDHHGGAAAGGGDDADRRAARGPHRHPRQQRQALDQAVERVDARDPAVGEERVGHVVLAGERAGMRHRELARRLPSARACRRGSACRVRRPRAQSAAAHRHCAWFRGTACSRRCRGHPASLRKFRRATDRPRCRPTPGRRSRCRAPCRATAATPIMLPECEAAKMRPAGRSFSSKAALAVSIARRAQVDDAEA